MMVRHTLTARHPLGKRSSRLALLSLLTAAMLVFVFFPRPLGASGRPKYATILSPTLNMRSGPGLYHPSIGTLRRGDRVLVLSYEGEWVRILFKDRTGFIMNRSPYVQIDEADTTPVEASTDPTESDEATDRKLEAREETVASFSKEETAIVNALDDTEKELNTARKKVVRLTAELEALERQLVEIEDNYREIEDRAATTERYVAGRLAALYKLSWLGKFHVLASADSMVDFFSRKWAMERILAHDETVMAQLARDKAEMKALLSRLADRKHEKQITAQELQSKIDTMHAQQVKREAILADIRGKKSLQLAAIESLKASARELDRTVDALRTAKPQQTSALPTPAEKPFAALKGLLMMPVKGTIISFFGPKKDETFNVTRFQTGITIKADRGEPIRAVYSGRTLFSSWFKGFGNMIILDHGDHYYTVYAHLEEQFKAKGDPVETGEVIATVGDTGSLTGAGLHFEVRHRGKPMNPLGWIKKG